MTKKENFLNLGDDLLEDLKTPKPLKWKLSKEIGRAHV